MNLKSRRNRKEIMEIVLKITTIVMVKKQIIILGIAMEMVQVTMTIRVKSTRM